MENQTEELQNLNIEQVEPVIKKKRGRKLGSGKPKPEKIKKIRGRKLGDKVKKLTWNVKIKRNDIVEDLGDFTTKAMIGIKLTEIFGRNFSRDNVDSIIRGFSHSKSNDIIITKLKNI